MMGRILVIALATALALGAQVSHGAQGGQVAGSDRWDFSYSARGAASFAPLQTFDDGKDTYFQFPPGGPVPAIFGASGQLLQPMRKGELIMVSGADRTFTLRLGREVMVIAHESVVSGVLMPTNQVKSVRAPSPESKGNWQENSYAQPVRGDVIEFVESQRRAVNVPFSIGSDKLSPQAMQLLKAIASRVGDSPVTVVGRDDDSMKDLLPESRADAIKRALVGFGVPAAQIRVKPGVAKAAAGKVSFSDVTYFETRPAAAAQEATGSTPALSAAPHAPAAPMAPSYVAFEIRSSDADYCAVLKRWAKSRGKSLVCSGAPVAVQGQGVVMPTRDLDEALGQVKQGLRAAGYQVDIRLYADGVYELINE